jgi:hypothetical protein
LLLAGCALGDRQWWDDGGAPNQLVLGSTDQGCTLSPDVAGGVCCLDHDSKFWVGGTDADRLAADAELLACLALWGVPEPVAMTYFWAVRKFGATRWNYTEHRTRGPAR